MFIRLLHNNNEWTSGEKQIDYIIIAGSRSKEYERSILWRQVYFPFNLSLSNIHFHTGCGAQTS